VLGQHRHDPVCLHGPECISSDTWRHDISTNLDLSQRATDPSAAHGTRPGPPQPATSYGSAGPPAGVAMRHAHAYAGWPPEDVELLVCPRDRSRLAGSVLGALRQSSLPGVVSKHDYQNAGWRIDLDHPPAQNCASATTVCPPGAARQARFLTRELEAIWPNSRTSS
jgi:hypothetical protein